MTRVFRTVPGVCSQLPLQEFRYFILETDWKRFKRNPITLLAKGGRRKLDFLMEQIEDEIEESGEASKEAMDRLELFCRAMNVKVDRIGCYLAVMEVRAEHCRKEAARYAARAKRAQSKIDRTKAMVLYYLESHDLKQVKTDDFTLRRPS